MRIVAGSGAVTKIKTRWFGGGIQRFFANPLLALPHNPFPSVPAFPCFQPLSACSLCFRKGPEVKIGHDHEYAEHIEKKILEEGYSPGAVLGEIEEEGLTFKTKVSKTTLYRYIANGVLFGQVPFIILVCYVRAVPLFRCQIAVQVHIGSAFHLGRGLLLLWEGLQCGIFHT